MTLADTYAEVRVLEQVPFPAIITTVDGQVEFMNTAFTQTFPALAKLKRTDALFSPEQWDRIHQGKDAEVNVRFDFEFNQKIQGWAAFATVLNLDNQNFQLVSFKQQSLHSEASILELSSTAYMKYNVKSGNTHWSDSMFVLLGLSKESNKSSYERFESYIHSEDKEFVKTMLLGLDKEATDPIQLEFRLNLSSGVKWVSAKCQVLNEPLETLLFGFDDITDKKVYEEELTQSYAEILLCQELITCAESSDSENEILSRINDSIKLLLQTDDVLLYKSASTAPTELELLTTEIEPDSIISAVGKAVDTGKIIDLLDGKMTCIVPLSAILNSLGKDVGTNEDGQVYVATLAHQKLQTYTIIGRLTKDIQVSELEAARRFLLQASQILIRFKTDNEASKTRYQLEDLFANMSDGVILLDGINNVEFVNAQALKIFNCDSELSLDTVTSIAPGIQEFLKVVRTGAELDNYQITATLDTSEVRFLSLAGSARYEEGNYVGARIILRDDTKRIRFDLLKELISKIAARSTQQSTSFEYFEYVHDQLSRVVSYKECEIVLLDSQNEEVNLVYNNLLVDEEQLNERIPLENSRYASISDIEIDEFGLSHDLLTTQEGESSNLGIIVPFKGAGEIFGAMALIRHRNDEFTNDDQEIILYAANQIAPFIQKKFNDQKLIESERKYRNIFESLTDVFFQSSLSGKIVNVSPSVKSLLGLDQEEVLGKKVEDIFVYSFHRKIMADGLAKYGKIENFETLSHHRNGDKVYLSLTVSLRFDERGTVIGTQGMIRNITDKRKAQGNLARAQRNLKEAQRLASIGSFEYDMTDNRVQYWSDVLNSIFEIDVSVEIDEALYEIEKMVLEPDKDKFKLFIQGGQSGKSRFDFKIDSSKGIKYIRCIGRTLTTTRDDSPTIVMGTFQDITIEKIREGRLEHANKRLTALYSIQNEVMSSFTAQEMCERALKVFKDFVLPYDRASVTVFNNETSKLEALYFDEISEVETNNYSELTISDVDGRELLLKGEAYYVPDISKKKNTNQKDEMLKQLGIQSYLMAPLMSGDKLLGTLNIGFREINGFSLDDLELIKEFSSIIALAMERHLLMQKLNENERYLTLSKEYATLLLTAAEFEDTGRTICKQLVQDLEFDSAIFINYAERNNSLSILAEAHKSKDNYCLPREALTDKDSIVWRAVESRKHLKEASSTHDDEVHVAVPLIADNHVLGVVFGCTKKVEEIALVESLLTELSGHASLKLRNAQMVRQVNDIAKFPEENPNPVMRLNKHAELLYYNQIAAHDFGIENINSELPAPLLNLIKDFIESKQPSFETEISVESKVYKAVFFLDDSRNTNLFLLDETELKNAYDKLKVQHAKALMYHSRLLSSQINPHFMFNALNSIQYYILENETEPALNFLTSFAKLVRIALQNSSKEFISLADEIEFIKLYVGLEMSRHNDKFTYEINFDSDLEIDEIFLPPMLLQPYIENAIIHGLGSLQADGMLEIHIEEANDNRLIISIDDNGIGVIKSLEMKKMRSASPHRSMAMKITNTRLEILNDLGIGEFNVEVLDRNALNPTEHGTRVQISIPSDLNF